MVGDQQAARASAPSFPSLRARWSTALGLPWLLISIVLAVFTARPAAADPKDDFKAGIASADLGQWRAAVAHFRRAIEGDPEESGDQVFLSGVFSRPYLPYFYLGDALVHLDRDTHCEEALVAWRESARQGVVQGFRRQLKELEQGRDDCLKRVLPGLESRLRQNLTRAESTARGLPSSMPSPALERRRSDLEAQLAGAGEMLKQVDASTASGAGLDLLRRALATVESMEEGLAQLKDALDSHNSEALDSARASTRRAIIDAEGAHEALGDLPDADSERLGLAQHISQLATARQRLAAAGDVESLKEIQRSAEVASSAFDRARRRLAADRRATLPAPRSAPAQAPPAQRERGIGSAPASPRPSTSPPAVAAADPEDVEDPRVRTWADHGRRLLAELGDPPSDRRLLGLQHARLRTLLDERERTLGDAEPWLVRIQETVLALRLLAGIEAYLDGEHRRALTLMTSDLLTEAARSGEDASERSDRDPIRAQMYLFRAAAGLSLFRLGGEVEGDLERRAAEDARRSRTIHPDLEPSVDVFSPAFRSFFSAAFPTADTGS